MTTDRKQLEQQMKSCMQKHADFMRVEMMKTYCREVIVETLIGAVTILTIDEIGRERPDISERKLDTMTHDLLSEFHASIDSMLAKHLDQGERN